MQSETPPGARKKRAHQPKRPKTRLLTFSDIDGRTRARQWAEEKRDEIVADLGGANRLSTLELLQVENAAIDAAVLRDMQMRWLKGEDIAPAAMATTENTFNRTAEALGTKRRAKDITPDVATYIRHLEGEAK